MPRIRTIKPEFWDSPSTAKAGPWARLAYIGMWNWADDHGRGTANLKELEGFIFPNDDTFTDCGGNTVNFRDLVAEVAECFNVVFYEVDGRPFYQIFGWDRHQRNERRAKDSRHPAPPDDEALTTGNARITEMHGISAAQTRKSSEIPRTSEPGTGEQGNRGTGEQSSLSANADASEDGRDDVDSICEHLAARIVANGNKPPTVTKAWKRSARLMLDRDNRDADEAHRLIDWCQSDAFWMSNILSMPKFREKYDQLRLRAEVVTAKPAMTEAERAWREPPPPPAWLYDDPEPPQ